MRVVILQATGKGFQAGVDIKELAADPTNESLVRVNRGCYEAFGAVYDCEVPVIAAVNGFCLGGGVALAGNADIVVASDDATFGLPEVDRGALGTATHLARFVPQHKLRAMFYTGKMITALHLHEPLDDRREHRADVPRGVRHRTQRPHRDRPHPVRRDLRGQLRRSLDRQPPQGILGGELT